jgi:4-carboxymuconolactone decarboxylase
MAAEDFVTDRGRQAAIEMWGPTGGDRMEANNRAWAERVDDDWAHIISDFIINGMYSRNVLPTATRELCAVAALTVLQRMDELSAHIRIALRSNPEHIVREVILQMCVYGGIPVTTNAMRLFESILAESSDAT